MAKEIKYTADLKNHVVLCGRQVIAMSYVGEDKYEVRILQGMPRKETWEKIFKDCPEFAELNDMNINIVPALFSKNQIPSFLK